METMISIPESLYLRLVDYFDDKSDADGDSEGFTPNEEMKLLTELQNCKPCNSFIIQPLSEYQINSLRNYFIQESAPSPHNTKVSYIGIENSNLLVGTINYGNTSISKIEREPIKKASVKTKAGRC